MPMRRWTYAVAQNNTKKMDFGFFACALIHGPFRSSVSFSKSRERRCNTFHALRRQYPAACRLRPSRVALPPLLFQALPPTLLISNGGTRLLSRRAPSCQMSLKLATSGCGGSSTPAQLAMGSSTPAQLALCLALGASEPNLVGADITELQRRVEGSSFSHPSYQLNEYNQTSGKKQLC